MYIIIADKNTDKVIKAVRTRPENFVHWFIRAQLLKVFTGTIYSPMEQAPKGVDYYVVYASPNKEGIGRIHFSTQLWAVEK